MHRYYSKNIQTPYFEAFSIIGLIESEIFHEIVRHFPQNTKSLLKNFCDAFRVCEKCDSGQAMLDFVSEKLEPIERILKISSGSGNNLKGIQADSSTTSNWKRRQISHLFEWMHRTINHWKLRYIHFCCWIEYCYIMNPSLQTYI